MLNPLDEHFGYLSDRVKFERYEAAIKHAVRAGHVVMDLGCGSGLLGLLALRAGADKVLFVEEGAIIEVARRVVTEAGFAERSQFFNLNSYEIDLPERVDVVLCDHVGYFGFDYGILALLSDARNRFLKPRGIILPAEIHLGLAPVESESCRDLIERWRADIVPEEFRWVGAPAANTKHAVQLGPGDLLANSAELGTLVLGAEAGEYHSWQADFTAHRTGTLDGVAGWFDCVLFGDIRMTNSPIADVALDRPQAFLPLEEPVSVTEGEQISITVMARHLDHIIAWIVELPDQGARFSMSTFNGLLIDRETIDRGHPDRLAKLNARGRARQLVLSNCDGVRTVAEVEALVLREHSDLFPSTKASRDFVRSVLTSDTSE